MNFKEWILQYVGENSAIGDLANDISNDVNFPDLNSKEDIENYLESQGACYSAMATFNEAWMRYREQH